uniref:C2 domain-containing protein n=1 Tax=Macrostomum lignano TaxID=282301 RepID=A0A1I8FAF3_9PLAT
VIQRQPIRVGAVLSHLSADLTQRDQQLRQLEAQLAEQRQKHSELVSRLSKENRQLLSRVSSSGSGVPRMFQRFTGAAKSGASAAVGGAGDSTGGPFDAERAELQVRLAEQERRVERQRKERPNWPERWPKCGWSSWSDGAERLGDCGEGSRKCGSHATRLQRESTEWRVRAESLQETLAKESQRWVGERVSLQFASQQLRLVVDQWLDRFQGAVEEISSIKLESEENRPARQDELRATLQVIVDEIGKYKLRARAVWTGAAVHRERATRPAAPAPSAKRRFYQGFDERLFSGDGGSKSSEQKKPSEQAKPKPQMQLKPVAAPSGGSRFGGRTGVVLGGQADAPGLGGGGSGQPEAVQTASAADGEPPVRGIDGCPLKLHATCRRIGGNYKAASQVTFGAGEAATSHSRVTGSPARQYLSLNRLSSSGGTRQSAVQQPRAAGVSSDAAEAASISTPLSAGSSITLMTQWHSAWPSELAAAMQYTPACSWPTYGITSRCSNPCDHSYGGGAGSGRLQAVQQRMKAPCRRPTSMPWLFCSSSTPSLCQATSGLGCPCTMQAMVTLSSTWASRSSLMSPEKHGGNGMGETGPARGAAGRAGWNMCDFRSTSRRAAMSELPRRDRESESTLDRRSCEAAAAGVCWPGTA